jgi:hypothetical protein
MFAKVRDWYEGKFHPAINDPGSDLIFTSPGHREEPVRSAKIARAFMVFCQREWKWIVTTLVAIIGGIWLKVR